MTERVEKLKKVARRKPDAPEQGAETSVQPGKFDGDFGTLPDGRLNVVGYQPQTGGVKSVQIHEDE